ncbi:MAG: hypothetical protein HQK88_06065 [Nitrospirae bacterium]|nr:hypothetical protein [Nitrospirota bacterium]MBF0534590.1 hypothetical protein [Nitrospirota bacterium]MBF0616366.1 hypothetical protein [Nitrospirota bacterium]
MAIALYEDTSEGMSVDSSDISELRGVFNRLNEEETKITEEMREYFFLY